VRQRGTTKRHSACASTSPSVERIAVGQVLAPGAFERPARHHVLDPRPGAARGSPPAVAPGRRCPGPRRAGRSRRDSRAPPRRTPPSPLRPDRQPSQAASKARPQPPPNRRPPAWRSHFPSLSDENCERRRRGDGMTPVRSQFPSLCGDNCELDGGSGAWTGPVKEAEAVGTGAAADEAAIEFSVGRTDVTIVRGAGRGEAQRRPVPGRELRRGDGPGDQQTVRKCARRTVILARISSGSSSGTGRRSDTATGPSRCAASTPQE
jgi:hypothetical protein